MKIRYSNIIPFKGFYAINLFGVLFIRKQFKDKPINKEVLNHESIHTAQMKELLYLPFYVWYFIEWLIRLCINGNNAYKNIVFEREAYLNESNSKYLSYRKHFNWFKYYGKNLDINKSINEKL